MVEYVESSWRHRQLSNENIHYFVNRLDRTIHDKRCHIVRAIPDNQLDSLAEYRQEFQQCKKCAMRAYIQTMTKDSAEIDEYERFFTRTTTSIKLLRTICIDKNIKTRIMRNCLTLCYKEDTWKIISLDEDGYVQLMHNNYRKNEDRTRTFVKGFHIQNEKCKRCRIQYAISVIINYDYTNHFINNVEVANEDNKNLKLETQALEIAKKSEINASTSNEQKWKILRKIQNLYVRIFRKKK